MHFFSQIHRQSETEIPEAEQHEILHSQIVLLKVYETVIIVTGKSGANDYSKESPRETTSSGRAVDSPEHKSLFFQHETLLVQYSEEPDDHATSDDQQLQDDHQQSDRSEHHDSLQQENLENDSQSEDTGQNRYVIDVVGGTMEWFLLRVPWNGTDI